jgi:hypothetical protein
MNVALLANQAECGIEQAVADKLCRISPATIDRILTPERKKIALKGRSHTRAGSLLKHQIPIRRFHDWDERKPGFFEADTVANDSGYTTGEYCWMLTATDVCVGWVDLQPLRNRAFRWVKENAETIRHTLPSLCTAGIPTAEGSS